MYNKLIIDCGLETVTEMIFGAEVISVAILITEINNPDKFKDHLIGFNFAKNILKKILVKKPGLSLR